MRTVNVRVNGSSFKTEVKDNSILLDVLREQLLVQSVKAGCWRGECGLCTILLNGKPVKSCLVLGVEADGGDILTAEGLMKEGVLSPLQKAFVDHGAMQCGFCTPAFIVTAHHLLTVKPHPSDEEIKEYLTGLICRCGTYKQMITAIRDASKHYHKIGKKARQGKT